MKITFYSNFMNHHQLPFSLAMSEKLGDKFKFVACTPIAQERLNMGYKDLNDMYDFIVRPYKNKLEDLLAEKLAIESDIIIFGSGDEKYLTMRMKQNKTTFRYSERLFKKGVYRRFIPVTYKKINQGYLQYINNQIYVLCSSAYTAYDLNLCGFPIEKCFKWGYFPEVKKYDIHAMIKAKTHNEILWAGRFIDLKHPEMAVKVAQKLKNDNTDFHLTMVGDGEEFPKIEKMINQKGLDKYISLTGSMSPDCVREYMEKCSIYLFTSDFNEGWGAVLNESMNSGCAVVASHAIGSVPFLIHDNENGLIYKNGDINDLYNKVKSLIDNPEKRMNIGKKAYLTMVDTWNADLAAERFIRLAAAISKNEAKPDLYTNGPCSRAKRLHNVWYKQKYRNK